MSDVLFSKISLARWTFGQAVVVFNKFFPIFATILFFIFYGKLYGGAIDRDTNIFSIQKIVKDVPCIQLLTHIT